jgi:glutamine amidotransferase
MKVALLDLDFGNLRSIKRALSYVDKNFEVIITNDPYEINRSDKLIISGVGAYDTAVRNLEKYNLRNTLDDYFVSQRQILGICLGMQLMANSSEEGNLPGLGWVDCKCKKFDSVSVNVPHMGWNIVEYDKDCNLFRNTPTFYNELPRFYFVHSYYIDLNDNSYKIGTTNYQKKITSSFSKNNLYGVQFHPEKSLSYGINLLKNFICL